MPERYPGYDVLRKRDTLSWNEATRRVIDARLALADAPGFFSADEWLTLRAVCARITPQPEDRPPIPVARLVDHKIQAHDNDGYRNARLPPLAQAWRRGLAALDEAAYRQHGCRLHELDAARVDDLLHAAQDGRLDNPAWGDMPPALFFKDRLLRDIVYAYYSHPTAWSEIGFGGPASPRGYVRMDFDRRDPWEAVELPPGGARRPGEPERTRRRNQRVR